MRNLHFYTDFLVIQKNNLIKNLWLLSEFMTLQNGQQTITIHILPNISETKGKQTMKFDQVIEYNMRNIFLEKSYAKCDGEISLVHFCKTF